MKNTYLLLAAALSWTFAPDALADSSPVRIASMESGPSSYNGPGRIFRKGHPARFQVVLVNRADVPCAGTLAAEVTSHLETVYGLASSKVELKPRQRLALTFSWDYPGTAVEKKGNRRFIVRSRFLPYPHNARSIPA